MSGRRCGDRRKMSVVNTVLLPAKYCSVSCKIQSLPHCPNQPFQLTDDYGRSLEPVATLILIAPIRHMG